MILSLTDETEVSHIGTGYPHPVLGSGRDRGSLSGIVTSIWYQNACRVPISNQYRILNTNCYRYQISASAIGIGYRYVGTSSRKASSSSSFQLTSSLPPPVLHILKNETIGLCRSTFHWSAVCETTFHWSASCMPRFHWSASCMPRLH